MKMHMYSRACCAFPLMGKILKNPQPVVAFLIESESQASLRTLKTVKQNIVHSLFSKEHDLTYFL